MEEKTMNLAKQVRTVELDGDEYILTLDVKAINHFKVTSKKQFLQSVPKFLVLDDEVVFYMLGSMLRKDEKSEPVGRKFLEQFNPFLIVEKLWPVAHDVITGNLPKANGDSEKK